MQKIYLLMSILGLLVIVGCDSQSASSWDCESYPCIYTSPEAVTPDFGGVLNADLTCWNNRPDGATTAFAYLADGVIRQACSSFDCATGGNAEHINWVLDANAAYYRPDGTLIGTTGATKLFNRPLTNSFTTSGQHWTGMNYYNTSYANKTGTCNGWTTNSNLEGIMGYFGSSSETARFNNAGVADCTAKKNILCVATGSHLSSACRALNSRTDELTEDNDSVSITGFEEGERVKATYTYHGTSDIGTPYRLDIDWVSARTTTAVVDNEDGTGVSSFVAAPTGVTGLTTTCAADCHVGWTVTYECTAPAR